MAGPWLYVISSGPDHSFTLADGESIPVSLDSYRALIENGRIVEDRYWYVSQNWKNIDIGDDLFIYTGVGDVGIIGYATVVAVEPRGDRWCVVPQFDLRRCKDLLDHPVPATVVKEWLVVLRKSVINLAPFQDQLRARLPWSATLDDWNQQFEHSVSEALQRSGEERRSRISNASSVPKRVTVTATVFERNPDVVAEVLARADGICEHCKSPAPFVRRSNGTPYLEVHHIRRLADGGEDTVENAEALCPNCHREAHYS